MNRFNKGLRNALQKNVPFANHQKLNLMEKLKLVLNDFDVINVKKLILGNVLSTRYKKKSIGLDYG